MKHGSEGSALACMRKMWWWKMRATSRALTARMSNCSAMLLRILTLRWSTAGFAKHSSSVATAMACGIAQKLKTDWFWSRPR